MEVDPAHDPRAGDGRALLAGGRRRLPRDARRRATTLGKFFPMLITAAGTAEPAGCWCSAPASPGLQAIATAKRLGAVVEAYDVRPAVKEEVESLGAKFVQIEVEQEGEGGGSGEYAKELLRGDAAPPARAARRAGRGRRLRDHDRRGSGPAGAEARSREEMVRAMSPGSVIVDMAAETGGNCELTEPGRGRRRRTASRSTGRSTCRARCPSTPACCTRTTSPTCSAPGARGRAEARLRGRDHRRRCVTHDGQIVNERVREADRGSR